MQEIYVYKAYKNNGAIQKHIYRIHVDVDNLHRRFPEATYKTQHFENNRIYRTHGMYEDPYKCIT